MAKKPGTITYVSSKIIRIAYDDGEKAEIHLTKFSRSNPVSYTHLDVYKRQVVAGVWKDTVGVVQKLDYGKQTATINVEMFGRETPVAVSYTHLDVYKRQSLPRWHFYL